MRIRLGNLQEYFNQMQAPQGPIMSPDEIRDFLARKRPELVAEERNDPDRWALFLGPAQQEPSSNRIVRAVHHSQGAPNSNCRCRHDLKGQKSRSSAALPALASSSFAGVVLGKPPNRLKRRYANVRF